MILQEKSIYSLVSKMILFREKKGNRKYCFLVYSIIYKIQFTLSAPDIYMKFSVPAHYIKCSLSRKSAYTLLV